MASEKRDPIEQAIAMADSGEPMDATRLLWPIMATDEDRRDDAMYALAFCFEKANNFVTANYLYDEILEIHPDFEAAIARRTTCRTIVEERGLIEDFSDLGHRDCKACRLRYRSEHMLCPYCGQGKDSARSYTESSAEGEEDIPPGWEDPSILDTIEGMGRDAADRIQDLVESDTVRDLSKKVSSATRSTIDKAKGYTEGEKAREIRKKSANLGEEVVGRAEKLSENSTIRDVARHIEEISWKASDAVKDFVKGGKSDSPTAEGESGGDFADRARAAGKSLLRSIRDAIDPDKDRR